MLMNGSPHPLLHQAVDHTPILVHIASRVGRIEARQTGLVEDIREIKADVSKLQRPRRPLAEYITPAIGAAILAAAAAGKITWAEALPSLLGLVGGR